MTDDIAITEARTEDLDEAVRASIVALCCAAHNEPNFVHLFTYVPEGGWHFLAHQGSELVSHALVTTRWLQPAGHGVLKTAWVDAVCTAPALQGRGYGSAVMRCLARSVAGGYAIAGLQTDVPGFYTRLGWEEWRGPLAGRGEDGLVPTPTQTGVMILRHPRTPVVYLQTLLTIECTSERIW
jgi:GNAT superfamily N-acetyltransferase